MKYKLLKVKFYYNNKMCKHIYEKKCIISDSHRKEKQRRLWTKMWREMKSWFTVYRSGIYQFHCVGNVEPLKVAGGTQRFHGTYFEYHRFN